MPLLTEYINQMSFMELLRGMNSLNPICHDCFKFAQMSAITHLAFVHKSCNVASLLAKTNDLT